MVLGKKKEEYQLAHKQLASMAPDHARDLAPHVPCSVLLDKATQQRASASPRVVFEPREPVSVKGKAVLIDVFLPGLVACEGSLVTRRLSVDECMGEVVLYDHFEEAAARLLGCERVEEQVRRMCFHVFDPIDLRGSGLTSLPPSHSYWTSFGCAARAICSTWSC